MTLAEVATGTVVEELSLEELSVAANREHALVEQALTSAVEHAIRCGDALLVVRERFAHTGWEQWCAENFDGPRIAVNHYMRLAHYQDRIRSERTIRDAMTRLRGLPAIRPQRRDGYPPEIRQAALRMLDDGHPKTEIADMLGVSSSTVAMWADPEVVRRHRARLRKQNEERRRKTDEERREREHRKMLRLAKKSGAAISEAYSLAHKLEDALGAAQRNAKKPEHKAALAEAIRHHHAMKDQIVKALVTS